MSRKQDLSGQTFGSWFVSCEVLIGENKKWYCICACGAISYKTTSQLNSGRTNRCGSCRMNQPAADLTGHRVGILTVLGYHGLHEGPRKGTAVHHWKCRCDCGNEIIVRHDHLGAYASKTKIRKSCGCMRNGKNNYGWKGYEELSGQYWNQLQKGARERQISFDITIEDVWNLFLHQDRKCALTGMPLSMHFTGEHSGDASLDRVDSNLGYTRGNVQWVHKHINQMKLDHDQDYFVSLCRAVANHNALPTERVL